jgi:hypothetical protein
MNVTAEPTFPAMLVHDDGSITALRDKDTWPYDPDLWYWSEPSDYLIDYSGTYFEQTGTRGADGHPTEPPGWRALRSLPASDLRALVLSHLAAEGIDVAGFQTAAEGIAETEFSAFAVDYVLELDSREECTEAWPSFSLKDAAKRVMDFLLRRKSE